jgi:hypothetical protein
MRLALCAWCSVLFTRCAVALDYLHSGIVELNSEMILRVCLFLSQFSFS